MSASLTTDGESLFVVYSSGDLVHWDISGEPEVVEEWLAKDQLGVELPDAYTGGIHMAGGVALLVAAGGERAWAWVRAGEGWTLQAVDCPPSQRFVASPLGGLVACLTDDGKVVLDALNSEGKAVLTAAEDLECHYTAECLAFSPNGRWLAAGSGRRIALWDLEGVSETKMLDTGEADRYWTPFLAFSADSKLLATYSTYISEIRVWRVAGLSLVSRDRSEFKGAPVALEFSADSSSVTVVFLRGILRHWAEDMSTYVDYDLRALPGLEELLIMSGQVAGDGNGTIACANYESSTPLVVITGLETGRASVKTFQFLAEEDLIGCSPRGVEYLGDDVFVALSNCSTLRLLREGEVTLVRRPRELRSR